MKKVFECINKVQKKISVTGIGKDNENKMQHYKFRGIDDVLNSLSSIIADAGLVIIPEVIERTVTERQTKSGGVLFYTVVKVNYHLISFEDSSDFSAVIYGEAMDSSDKSTNKAMSAAYKYMAIQTFCIPIKGEDDADSETHEVISNAKPVYSNNDDKSWFDDFDKHEATMIERIVSGKETAAEIVTKLRMKYKVNKEIAAKIMALSECEQGNIDYSALDQ